ncbi:MAG: response regulator [Deltaproteobacteria bacterium]|nr:response regulator [Candidatus Tharpella sp.]
MIRDRVVIVDSEIEIRNLLERIIRHENLISDTYADAQVALEALQERHDDVILVITDIKMPQLNGIEFMRLASQDFPDTPFIVTSEHGTKKEVIQALKQGAIDYFEKPFGSKEVSSSVRKVKLLADADLKTIQIYRNLVKKSLVFEISNDIELVQPLVSGLANEIKLSCRIPRSHLPGMRMGLHELIVNAIEHGNLELDSELKQRHNYLEFLKRRSLESRFSQRKVTIEVTIAAKTFSCIIRDQGPGFDWRSLPDPGDPENLFKPHGRGIIMAGNFFYEFSFNEKGNQVTVRKFFKENGNDL